VRAELEVLAVDRLCEHRIGGASGGSRCEWRIWDASGGSGV
jgi:hypothetical protein